MTFANQSLDEFTLAIAQRTPVPGGGAVAATTLAHASALGSMVVAFSLGKKALVAHEDTLTSAAGNFEAFRTEALRLADDDAKGFQELAKLFPLAKDDPERISAMPAAIKGAITPPQRIVTLANEQVVLCESLIGRTSKMLRSDLVIAARLGAVAADAAAWNVRVNLPGLAEVESEAHALDIGKHTEALVKKTEKIAQLIAERCAD